MQHFCLDKLGILTAIVIIFAIGLLISVLVNLFFCRKCELDYCYAATMLIAHIVILLMRLSCLLCLRNSRNTKTVEFLNQLY